MSRFVDSEKLKSILKGIKIKGVGAEILNFNDGVEYARDVINIIDLSTADSVEIVRCKDCKYNYGIANNCEYAKDDIVCCYWESDGLHSDDFCSKGEKGDSN